VHLQAQMWQMMMYQQQQAALSAAGSTAYMQQVQAYGQMMGALGVAPDGMLLAGRWRPGRGVLHPATMWQQWHVFSRSS
jgi:hypothetical protein